MPDETRRPTDQPRDAEERALELNRDTVGDLDAERGVGGKDVKGGRAMDAIDPVTKSCICTFGCG